MPSAIGRQWDALISRVLTHRGREQQIAAALATVGRRAPLSLRRPVAVLKLDPTKRRTGS